MNTHVVSDPSKGGQSGEHPEQGQVSITINGTELKTRPGQHRGADLKRLGNVPPEYELEQVVDGRFLPVGDEDKIHLRGGEIFVGHPRNCSSA